MNAGERKAFEEMMEALKRLQETLDQKKVELREFFASMTLEEMKTKMRTMETENLETLCQTLEAVEHENYEICEAAQAILTERRNK